MSDVHTKEIRSYNMSMIRGKNTKPELIIRKFLHSQGYRYGLHNKNLPGKPDIVLRKYKTVIFVNGCFWHGHKSCKYFVIPKTRTKWWINKIERNKENDRINKYKLENMGWNIITIWNCQLKSMKLKKTLNNLLLKLNEKK